MFKSGTYTWWQIGLLKVALLFIGVTIGSYWPEVFLPYAAWLIGLGVILGIYLAYVWVRQE